MLANLRALFGVVVDIVLLRRGPEHLPASTALLAVTMGLFAVIAGIVASTVAIEGHRWLLELVIFMAATVLWYRVALQLANKRERLLQTLTAMFAVRLVFAPLSMPAMSAWMTQAQAYEQTKVQPSTSLGMLVLGLLVWIFIVNVRIVRGAFEWTTFPAVLLVLGQEFAMLVLLAALLGAPAQST